MHEVIMNIGREIKQKELIDMIDNYYKQLLMMKIELSGTVMLYDEYKKISEMIEDLREYMINCRSYAELPMWKMELEKVNICPLRQDTLSNQIRDLRIIAYKFGFNDAGDFLEKIPPRIYDGQSEFLFNENNK